MKEDLDKNIRGTYSALGSSKVILFNTISESSGLIVSSNILLSMSFGNPPLARKNFFRGDLVAGTEMKDVVWLDKNLEEPSAE